MCFSTVFFYRFFFTSQLHCFTSRGWWFNVPFNKCLTQVSTDSTISLIANTFCCLDPTWLLLSIQFCDYFSWMTSSIFNNQYLDCLIYPELGIPQKMPLLWGKRLPSTINQVILGYTQSLDKPIWAVSRTYWKIQTIFVVECGSDFIGHDNN